MWKKIFMILVTLCSTCAVYIHFDKLNASTSPYHVNGTITGRIHTAPEGATNSTTGLRKGDKVYMGVPNQAYGTPYLEWQLLRQDTYTDYGCIKYDPNKKPVEQVCTMPEISSWYSLMTQDLGTVSAGFKGSDFYTTEYLSDSVWNYIKKVPYVSSPTIIPILAEFQNKIESSANDYKLLSYRNLTYARSIFHNTGEWSDPDGKMIKDSVLTASLGISETYNDLNRHIFLLPYEEIYWGQRTDIPKLPLRDRVFTGTYFTMYFNHDVNTGTYAAGALESNGDVDIGHFTPSSAINPNYKASVRPASYLNFDDVVFGVSQGDSSDTQTINATVLPQTYSSIIDATKQFKGMKLRIKNDSLSKNLIFHEIRSRNKSDVTQVTRSSPVELRATGELLVTWVTSDLFLLLIS